MTDDPLAGVEFYPGLAGWLADNRTRLEVEARRRGLTVDQLLPQLLTYALDDGFAPPIPRSVQTVPVGLLHDWYTGWLRDDAPHIKIDIKIDALWWEVKTVTPGPDRDTYLVELVDPRAGAAFQYNGEAMVEYRAR